MVTDGNPILRYARTEAASSRAAVEPVPDLGQRADPLVLPLVLEQPVTVEQQRVHAGADSAERVGARLIADVHGLARRRPPARERGLEDRPAGLLAADQAGR